MKSLDKKKTKELEWIKDWKQLNPNWTEVQISFIGSLLQDLEEEIRVQQRTELEQQKVKVVWNNVCEQIKKDTIEQILNLECLKEEKITKNIFSITQLESRNKLRNEIKDEIKKL